MKQKAPEHLAAESTARFFLGCLFILGGSCAQPDPLDANWVLPPELAHYSEFRDTVLERTPLDVPGLVVEGSPEDLELIRILTDATWAGELLVTVARPSRGGRIHIVVTETERDVWYMMIDNPRLQPEDVRMFKTEARISDSTMNKGFDALKNAIASFRDEYPAFRDGVGYLVELYKAGVYYHHVEIHDPPPGSKGEALVALGGFFHVYAGIKAGSWDASPYGRSLIGSRFKTLREVRTAVEKLLRDMGQ